MSRLLFLKKSLCANKNEDSQLQKKALFAQFDGCGLSKGIGSLKWEVNSPQNYDKPGYFPLWIADMDFPIQDSIKKALINRVSVDNFGYTSTSEEYYESIMEWYFKYHNGFVVKKEEIFRYSGKSMTGFCLILHALSNPGDSVLLLTPNYMRFFNSTESNERKLVESPLIYKNRTFYIDFQDVEDKILRNKVKIFVFCSPHNPVGRVWNKEEITRLQEICFRYNVIFVSDEVFGDLVFANNKHIVAASIKPFENNTVLLCSLGKAFNLNGVETGYCIIKNPEIMKKFEKSAEKVELFTNVGNIFSELVTKTAYKEGRFWLECVNEYIYENYKMMEKFFKEYIPEIEPMILEGSFVLLCDYNKLCITEKEFMKKTTEGNVIVNAGSMFHGPKGMFRINLACSRVILKGALERLRELFKN